ncbi:MULTISPECIES: hypothetical protein [unclassified Corallococcus]|uniref:hypothetical protein n=1 Tax=unclassified Corallococcus TaxID=2685029 RepID=UPI001A8FFB90|nr:MULTISPECIES: hypothetical protein [unclassified Corallococcus]MBN9688342.1 hypothetical protein [Corallococcus sp. NCSPR001]WAS87856.1 hypothetical protein O0N60_12950 [Corallococcus sp. NCRR]
MNSRLLLFASLLSCAVALMACALAVARGVDGAGVLALVPAVALLWLLVTVRQRAPRWRKEGAFQLSSGAWWSGSIAGGLLASVWAVMEVFAYFSQPGVCGKGGCALIIFYVPAAIVAALPLGMLISSAVLGAVGMVKGLKPVAVQGVLAGTAAFAFVLFLILGR